ncbi:hypothetical protein Tco_0650334 [Tanacetum coccineum]
MQMGKSTRSFGWKNISHGLWETVTMINASNDDTRISLTYGTEAVIRRGNWICPVQDSRRVQILRITSTDVRTFGKPKPTILIIVHIEISEQTNTGINITNATQDFKMRNLGRPKNRQLGERNAEVSKNRHKEVREWNTIVGIIKEPDLKEFCEKHYEKLLPIMTDKYEYERRKKEKLEEVKARLDFGEAWKKSTKVQESAYSESRTMSPRRQRSRQEEKVPYSRDLEAEDGVRSRTSIAVRKAQGIRKITLKAKIVKEDTGSLNHESRSTVSKMTISPNLGYVPRPIRSRLRFVTSTSQKHECLDRRLHAQSVKTTTERESEDPEDPLKNLPGTQKQKMWAMHPMVTYVSTPHSPGTVRVWFLHLPPEP